MVKGFKSISVPSNAKLVVASEPDAMPEVVLTPDTVTETEVDAIEASADVPHVAELSEKFLLAGNAVFTVTNPKGDHYTFRVRRVESEWPQGSGRMGVSYFVNVKVSGQDRLYAYIGLLNPTTGTVKTTQKSMYVPGSKEYDVASWACQAVIGCKMVPAGYHIEHAGRCGKCGRQLTDPQSIERGIGPECWSMIGSL
jgi:hypothetical protein